MWCFILDVTVSSKAQPIVSNIVDKLLDMLIHLINKNHDSEEHTLARLMIILMDARNLSQLSSCLLGNFHNRAGPDFMQTVLHELLYAEVKDANHCDTFFNDPKIPIFN